MVKVCGQAGEILLAIRVQLFLLENDESVQLELIFEEMVEATHYNSPASQPKHQGQLVLY